MQQKTKVLLAEDDLQLGFIIKDNLEEAGFQVINCPDGETAWEHFQKINPDICILDVNMPYRDGFSLAKKIRQKSDRVPILFLTAKSLEEDKLKGFAAGGDDYILKPFSMKELLSRMNVFLRRNKMIVDDNKSALKVGELSFYPDEYKLVGDTNTITLTQREAELLHFLCRHPNKVLKREEILSNVWGKNDFFLGRSMDVFMTRLRKLLAVETGVTIETIHGVGYRFTVNA
ncbi:response regulator transcription factor [Terrimonas sp. NA20]|uniref:Response regulator transcription factor n=1 Tax=Terrimonas ginsenosidimutans TaxID=2908004 RepID=A0ABS9KXW3_9BACT|nr:response regulator transcription factor [Terrimonas ginsenosidimutans]MCG2617146.1 response regulator transcription factor [Terrimonas ginsenosidimutans]